MKVDIIVGNKLHIDNDELVKISGRFGVLNYRAANFNVVATKADI